MRRLVVLLSICAGLGALGAVACGGNDKPPLTPDSVEPMQEGAEAGASPTSAPAPGSPAGAK